VQNHSTASDLSADVCELLDSCIDSVEALDALLVLHGDPSRAWALAEIARIIGVETNVTRQALGDLCARGLVAMNAAGALYRLGPLSPPEHAAFAELSRTYQRERRAIVEYVSRRSMARLRVLAQAFTRAKSV
jgi:hypothetical protein